MSKVLTPTLFLLCFQNGYDLFSALGVRWSEIINIITMKRLSMIMMCLLAMLALGKDLRAQEVSVTLLPGWTWIAYTKAETMSIDEAFGDFEPMEGDQIKSKQKTSTYRNGRWRGTMSVFNPGLGYHYYSNREVPVTLVFGGNSTLAVTTAMPTNITTSSVTCGGEVVDLGNNTVIVRGVCYSTQQNPTVADLHTTDGYGTGSFSSTLEGLEPGTIYFLRAYVVSDRGITYGGNVAFTTDQIHIYDVAVSANPANGGTVAGGGSFEQGLPCTVTATPATGYKFVKWTENGAQVSTSANYTFTVTGDRTLVAQFQLKSYTVTATADPAEGGTVTGGGTYTHGQTCTLTATPGEGYEFVNWTRNGDEVSTNATYSFTVTGTRTYVAHFQLKSHTVTATADPAEGGTVTGGGSYTYGQTCTLTATSATGYKFVKWTENGTQVSTSANYTFTVTGDRTLVAQFQLKSYTVTATADPAEGGTVTGGGTYTYGQTCTLTATSNERYEFTNWTRNGEVVSTNTSYSFTVTGNRTVVANFEETFPEGAINGLFSVSATKQVYFSQGNLQYIGSASTPYWKFAEHQWDYLGTSTGQNSTNQNVDRDLFGWGTSGYNHGAVCYQPWSTTFDGDYGNDYFAYGRADYNLYDITGQADWGYNPISNGGNQENQWHTLTMQEWEYVLNTRSTASGVRYAFAKVNGVNGMILLPDNWNTSYYSLYETNSSIYDPNYNINTITASQWSSLELHGSVFLPAAGCRCGTSVDGDLGRYWSASVERTSSFGSYRFDALYMMFGTSGAIWDVYRTYGFSVRLVCNAE